MCNGYLGQQLGPITPDTRAILVQVKIIDVFQAPQRSHSHFRHRAKIHPKNLTVEFIELKKTNITVIN